MDLLERRAKFSEGLSPLYAPKYQALCQILQPRWAPFYGLRTFKEQATLYARGRTLAPIGQEYEVTDADAGQSAHNYGCATDWTVWNSMGQPIWLQPFDPLWQEYRDACNQIGLKWGGSFPKPDRLHNELAIGCAWDTILRTYRAIGPDNIQSAIQREMK